ncbi:2756_t:CDS:1, partial [Racocetra fulgida]
VFAIINHDSVAGGTYGSINVVYLNNNDYKNNVTVTLQGCTPLCFISVKINFDQTKIYNDPDNIPNYYCLLSDYTFNLTVDMQVQYTGISPNSKHPAPPSVTYEYCLKGINIETGAPLDPKPDPGIASCINHLLEQTAPAFYPGPFGNYLNIEARRYLEYPVNNSSPSIARLVFASKNYLTYLSIFYDGIKYSFEELNRILPNMVDDLTPHAETGPNILLINLLLVFSTVIGAINFSPFMLPLGTIAGEEFGFFMQRILSGILSTGATNLGFRGNPEAPVRNLGDLQNQAETNMLKSLQSMVDDTFNNGVNYTLIDKYIDFNDTLYSDVDVGNSLLPGLKAAFASHILNFYDVVVCKPDNVQSICGPGSYYCCRWAKVLCVIRFECNDPVGPPSIAEFKGDSKTVEVVFITIS